MRIGVDSRPLREKRTSGIPMYVRSVLGELAKIDTENEYILYAHKDFEYQLPNSRWQKKSGALTRYGSVWIQSELPFWIKRDKIDIFWGTQHNLPILMPKETKAVLTVLDLVHLVFPETMKLLNFVINKMTIPLSVERADAIVAISNWTLQDVIKYLNPKNKIMAITYMGVGSQFHPRNIVEAKSMVSNRYNIKSPYILTVGTFEPRKNIHGVIEAYNLVADKIPHDLVIVGQKGWKNSHIYRNIENHRHKNRIHLLGYVEDEMIPQIYSAAELFIFPSLYEGFGIPPLEAMASGVPVIASNVSSIPEVVEDAALLVNPYKVSEIGEGILKIINDPSLKISLIEKGLRQASKFRWEITARSMFEIFSQLKK